ncbi:MAG: hypothetical protein JKY37_18090 [Nannocystaceae bacterium]|nr:hypothetical protein [Nannocystaceae bacterium]
MVGCRFESGLLVRSNAVRRGLSRDNAEILVRAGVEQQGEAFVTDLLGTVTTGNAIAEPQAAFEALVGLLMDGTLVVIRQETVPCVLDAPQIRDDCSPWQETHMYRPNFYGKCNLRLRRGGTLEWRSGQ